MALMGSKNTLENEISYKRTTLAALCLVFRWQSSAANYGVLGFGGTSKLQSTGSITAYSTEKNSSAIPAKTLLNIGGSN